LFSNSNGSYNNPSGTPSTGSYIKVRNSEGWLVTADNVWPSMFVDAQGSADLQAYNLNQNAI